MEVYEVIQDKRQETGITVAELSRRTGIKYERLRTSLEGKRGVTGSELVFISRELGLNINDFYAVDSVQQGADPLVIDGDPSAVPV